MDFYLANWDEMWSKWPVIRDKKVDSVLVSAFDIVRAKMRGQSARSVLSKRLDALANQHWPYNIMLDPGTYSIAQLTGDNERVGRGVGYRNTSARLKQGMEWVSRVRDVEWVLAYADAYAWCASELSDALSDRTLTVMELDFQEWVSTDVISRCRSVVQSVGRPVLYIYKGLVGPDLDQAMEQADKSSYPQAQLEGLRLKHQDCFYKDIEKLAIGTPYYALGGQFGMLAPEGHREHGLGVASIQEMLDWRYTSVDSSRWLAPSYWGELDVFDRSGMMMKRVPCNPRRKGFDPEPLKRLFLQPGTDQESIGKLVRWQIGEWQSAMLAVDRYWERCSQ